MKKIFWGTALSFGILLACNFDSHSQNQKMLHSFNTIFTQTSNVIWFEVSPNEYYVNFNQNKAQGRASFDTEGKLLHSVRYYRAQKLPLNIMMKVKNKHPNKKIFNVTEVTTRDGMAYIIKMETKDTWTVVSSDAKGNLKVTDKFDKVNSDKYQ